MRNLLSGTVAMRPSPLFAEEAVRALDELAAEVDRDRPSEAPPPFGETVSRENIYDDERHRI